MKLKIHIDRLTVEGMSRADGVRIGEALRTRLTELAAPGLLPKAYHISSVNAGELPRGATAEQIGRHTAGRIAQTLKGGGRA